MNEKHTETHGVDNSQMEEAHAILQRELPEYVYNLIRDEVAEDGADVQTTFVQTEDEIGVEVAPETAKTVH